MRSVEPLLLRFTLLKVGEAPVNGDGPGWKCFIRWANSLLHTMPAK